MEWLLGMGFPVVAMIITGYIGNKVGWGKAKGLIGKGKSTLTYALSNLQSLMALVDEISRASNDNKIDADELKRIIKKAKDLAQTIKGRTLIDDTLKDLS